MYNCSECSFNSDFDFSVDIHKKFEHPIYPRKRVFNCLKSSIQKHLCPEWDYETHLKVDFDDHLRRGHDSNKKKILYEINQVEEKCQNCDFQTFSKFLCFRHQRNGNVKCITKCGAVHPVEKVFIETLIRPEESQTNEIEVLSNKTKCLQQCDQCSYKTLYKHCMKNHKLRKHTPEDKIEWLNCPQCPYKAKFTSDLSCHVRRIHQSNDTKNCYECDLCEYKTYEKWCLERHRAIMHTAEDQIKWFHCEHCPYKVKLKSNLLVHVRLVHSTETNVRCDQCSFETNLKDKLKTHKLIYHPLDDEITLFYCEHCSYQTKLKKYLTRHIRTKHSSSQYLCDQCSFITCDKHSFKTHKIRFHTPEDEIKWFACEHCPYKGKNKQLLSQHIKIKHNDNYIYCDQCDYKTTKNTNLKYHKLKTHTSDDKIEWFYCTECPYKTAYKYHFISHMKLRHTSNLTKTCYECDQCEYKTYEKRYLQKHKSIQHTPEDQIKWFDCMQCQYRAKSNFRLGEHVKARHGSLQAP